MFSSSNSENPLSYTNETFFRQSFTFDQNPNSRQEDPPFFLHFPSPFLDDNEFPLHHTTPQQQLIASHGGLAESTTPLKILHPNSFRDSSVSTRQKEICKHQKCARLGQQKKIGKHKHKHSKIYTAQGLRDRRMRLSVQIARKFFDLQDLLGFDKASKTIEWLFTKSKEAINEINNRFPERIIGCSREARSESPMSECEAASGVEEPVNNEEMKRISAATVETLVSAKSNRKLRKGTYNPFARESRDKARARARERTRVKMMIRCLENSKQWFGSNPNNVEKLGFSNVFETGQGSNSHCQEKSFSLVANSHSLYQQLANVSKIGSTPCSMFDYDTNNDVSTSAIESSNFLEFQGNWDSTNLPMTNMVPRGNPSSVSVSQLKKLFRY